MPHQSLPVHRVSRRDNGYPVGPDMAPRRWSCRTGWTQATSGRNWACPREARTRRQAAPRHRTCTACATERQPRSLPFGSTCDATDTLTNPGSFRSLVFRLIHLHPALTMAMAFLARRCEARMCLALAVHVKGFGFWLRCGEQTLKFGAPLALEHDLRLLLPHPASESYSRRRWIQMFVTEH